RTPKEEFGIELLEDLLKAEDAVKKFTGEVQPQPGATGIRDDDGSAGTPLVGLSGGTSAGEPAAAHDALSGSVEIDERSVRDESAPPTRPYSLPAPTTLVKGTPAATRSGANDDIVAAITEVLAQFQ